MKSLVVLFILFGLAGCASVQERLAKRVGCDPASVLVKNQIHAPAYSEYQFSCGGKDYVCRDAPFVSTCDEDKGKKKTDDKAAPAADKKEEKKK